MACRKCERLENDYRVAIGEIYSVVGGRFKTVGHKLGELFRWQDVRDEAVKAIYEHKETHTTGTFEVGQEKVASNKSKGPTAEIGPPYGLRGKAVGR